MEVFLVFREDIVCRTTGEGWETFFKPHYEGIFSTREKAEAYIAEEKKIIENKSNYYIETDFIDGLIKCQ